MKPLVPPTALLAQRRTAGRERRAAQFSAAGDAAIPSFIADRLAELALLHGVPFEYLVPEASQLPPESIRFFALDPNWISALHEGVLSVGERSSVDAHARNAVRVRAWSRRLSLVRDRRRGRSLDAAALRARAVAPAPNAVSGFVLRSSVVTDYPGMQVRAHATLEPGAPAMTLLRLDRPAPGVLLSLFAGTLATVVLEEPHHGIRLGVDTSPNGNVLQLRRANGQLIAGASVDVPMRAGGVSGVVDVAALAQRIAQSGTPGVPAAVSSSVLALQLFQPPVRQQFRRRDP